MATADNLIILKFLSEEQTEMEIETTINELKENPSLKVTLDLRLLEVESLASNFRQRHKAYLEQTKQVNDIQLNDQSVDIDLTNQNLAMVTSNIDDYIMPVENAKKEANSAVVYNMYRKYIAIAASLMLITLLWYISIPKKIEKVITTDQIPTKLQDTIADTSQDMLNSSKIEKYPEVPKGANKNKKPSKPIITHYQAGIFTVGMLRKPIYIRKITKISTAGNNPKEKACTAINNLEYCKLLYSESSSNRDSSLNILINHASKIDPTDENYHEILEFCYRAHMELGEWEKAMPLLEERFKWLKEQQWEPEALGNRQHLLICLAALGPKFKADYDKLRSELRKSGNIFPDVLEKVISSRETNKKQ